MHNPPQPFSVDNEIIPGKKEAGYIQDILQKHTEYIIPVITKIRKESYGREDILDPSKKYHISDIIKGSMTEKIIDNYINKINNMLNADTKSVERMVAGFMQRASEQKDTKGQSNPRVVRSYIHAMLPDLKGSVEFRRLSPTEQRWVLGDINRRINKTPKKKR